MGQSTFRNGLSKSANKSQFKVESWQKFNKYFRYQQKENYR
jgi:hypothetical protein